MKALFFIEIPAHHPTEEAFYSWYKKDLLDECHGSDSLAELKNRSQLCDVVLVVPGFNVTLKQMNSKLKNRKKLQQAIAYELEEQLSEEIDNLFFAYQESNEKNCFDIAIINRDWFEQWLEIFKKHGILLMAAITDSMLLDTMPQEYLLIEKNSYYLLKTPFLRCVIDSENILYFLSKLKESLPDELLITNNSKQMSGMPVGVKLPLQDCTLKLMTEYYNFNNCFNLLQGIYKPKLKNDWQKIKWTAIGLFSLLLIATTFQGYQHWQLTQQEANLDQQRLKIFKKNFPDVKRIVNPLAQMKNELEKLQSNQQRQGQFVVLMAKVATALKEMLAQNKIQLVGMQFSDNELSVKLTASSMILINEVNHYLTAQQLNVEIESSDKSENQVNASFKITGK